MYGGRDRHLSLSSPNSPTATTFPHCRPSLMTSISAAIYASGPSEYFSNSSHLVGCTPTVLNSLSAMDMSDHFSEEDAHQTRNRDAEEFIRSSIHLGIGRKRTIGFCKRQCISCFLQVCCGDDDPFNACECNKA